MERLEDDGDRFVAETAAKFLAEYLASRDGNPKEVTIEDTEAAVELAISLWETLTARGFVTVDGTRDTDKPVVDAACLAPAATVADLTADRDRWLKRAGELQARLDAVTAALRPPDITERLRGAERPLTREWVCGCRTDQDPNTKRIDSSDCGAACLPCDARYAVSR